MRSVDLHLVPGGASVGSSPSEHGDPRERVPEGPGHSVQFYENEAFLAAAVADFVADGVVAEEPVLVIATATHRRAFVRRLRAKGVDVEQARGAGLLTWCDADAMLGRIMDGGQPNEDRFRAELGPLLERAELRRRGATVRAYGEMVDVLWQRGEMLAALRLEALWNELATTYHFALLCGYAMGPFYGLAGTAHHQAVCGCHTHVMPTRRTMAPPAPPLPTPLPLAVAHPADGETPDDADDVDDASEAERERDALRRQTRVLVAEVAERRRLEQQLRAALAEQRRVERELQRSRRLLLEAQRVARVGSWSVIPATGVTEWSDELWKLLGLSPEAGAPSVERLMAAVHEEDVAAVRAMLRRAAAAAIAGTSAPAADDVRIRHADGTVRICEFRVASTPASTQQPPMLHGTLLDVTAQRAAETERRALDARLLETQRLETLGVLAGGIAHDFNNLLTSILGNADMLQFALPEGTGERVLVDEILLAGRRSADLSRQLLAYAGHASYVVRALDLSALAVEVGALLRTAMPAGGTLRLDVPRGGMVAGDRAQLTQVLMNLVTNAAEALNPDGGTVTVRVREHTLDEREAARLAKVCATGGGPLPAGPCVRLEVSDTGVGMSREVRARMFEPFFTTKRSGRGLGLAATLGIVRAHGGALAVTSTQGQGTTVRVWLPAAPSGAEAERAGAVAASGAPAAVPQPRILVVDDDPAVRGTLARLLGRLRYDVVQAGGASEALAALDAGDAPPALAIVDFTMPEAGGQETAHRLQERCPGLPVLFTSGYGDAEAPGGATLPTLGERPLLPKPYDLRTLERLVGGALRARDAAPGG
ncbi:MEDS domain-containing protein [Roseisolibacter agri]|uniref:histidine kinase n=1 Tax=Roseisolibacter agri TaxID=2014610 RepID=A0AA37VCM1_9BACT|nr:MEDS domain-containing protein [Roseisolibacter agri]GLC27838.1 hypothetical protein rosag_43510 [Roseisolibacter agri]